MKSLTFHPTTLEFIREKSPEIRKTIGEALRDAQKGLSLGMPLSRPMPSVGHGAHELRISGRGATVRVFYFLKLRDRILVFHAFEKKTQKTPQHEIEIGKKRLREILNG